MNVSHDPLNLSLYNNIPVAVTQLQPPSQMLITPPILPLTAATTASRQPPSWRRARVKNNLAIPSGRSEIPQPYAWATTKRAIIQSLQYLKSRGIVTITGKVQCKRCGEMEEIHYDLHQKLTEVLLFMAKHKHEMRHRAPEVWMNPVLAQCRKCSQNNSMKPMVTKKKSINWLFMLLGQTLGACKLSELKYFCKHTKNHRTGAKDRVLYLTYMELCRQLCDPLRQ